jgi:hypothetical protein
MSKTFISTFKEPDAESTGNIHLHGYRYLPLSK